MNQKQKILLHLSLIAGIGPGKIEQLISGCGLEVFNNDFYSYSVKDFQGYGIPEKVAQIIINGLKDDTHLINELSLIEKYKVSWCTIIDDEYPSALKQIHLPPPILYYRGNLFQNCDKNISFVGARKAHHYGKRVLQKLIPGLVNDGWTIVSGGAYGIDTFSHQETINNLGKTIVVLGSGLLQLYPDSNRKLFNKVVESGGAVISSYSLQTAPHPKHFPARNRIIAGLSRGTVVVQAAQKSGSLITAHYALDEGRVVFAVPGQIDDPLSKGCHELLQKGAKLVMQVSDILDEFSLVANRAEIQTNILHDFNAPLVEACREAQSIDQLVEMMDLTEKELNDQLFQLQLEGKIDQSFTGLWEKI